MWTPIKTAQGLFVAEAWQDLMEGSGLPCELHRKDNGPLDAADGEYEVLVPSDRVHVVRLITGLAGLQGRRQ